MSALGRLRPPRRAPRGPASPVAEARVCTDPAPRTADGPGGPADGASGHPSSVHRVLSIAAAVGLFYPTLKVSAEIIVVPTSGAAAIVLTVLTLGLICAIAAARDASALERLDRWLLVIGLLTLAAWGGANLGQMGGYTTDEAAFVQSATHLFMHGHDPYGANLLPSLSQFAVPERFWTYTMSGGVVSTLGYPAFPLLATAPFVALTHNGQAVPIADLLALMVATSVMFAALPRAWRSLAVLVCVGFPVLPDLAISGDNVILMVAALSVVAWRWGAVGRGGRLGRGGVIRAGALGLALSTNQLAWFIAPFVIVGIFLSRKPELGRRSALAVTARYAGAAVVTFAALNVPFILWGPGAWLDGVLAPVSQHALPYGQGLVGLTAFLRVGGGAISAYTYAAGCVYLALLALYALDFDRLARCCFVFPSLALFVGARSLWTYWAALVSVIVISIATDEPTAEAERARAASREVSPRGRVLARWRSHPTALAALFIPGLAWLVVALATPAPLSLSIVSTHENRVDFAVDALRVSVHNGSNRALTPHFSINSKYGQASPFWVRRAGPVVLAAGATATYDLAAPDIGAMPQNGARFLLQAVTGTPLSISSSAPYVQSGALPTQW